MNKKYVRLSLVRLSLCYAHSMLQQSTVVRCRICCMYENENEIVDEAKTLQVLNSAVLGESPIQKKDFSLVRIATEFNYQETDGCWCVEVTCVGCVRDCRRTEA